jgi:hypothetical protein
MAKKTTKKTAKGKKLDNLAQTHGKEERFQPTSLEQIWGDDGMSKYSTFDPLTYEDALGDYSKVDLQTHATKVGVVPVDNTTLLRQRLMKEFHKHVNAYRMPTQPVNDPTIVSKEVRQILEEGK